MERPLILVTNDDGIDSLGLWANVEALLPLGDVLVVAPDRQWSCAARSMPPDTSAAVKQADRRVGQEIVRAIAIDASPAQAVLHAVLQLSPRRPDLVVSGTNYGYNAGAEASISGTVGAAAQASVMGIPGLAVSLEMDASQYLSGDQEADYSVAAAYAQSFGRLLLQSAMPGDVHVLSVNVPGDATLGTPWRLTRVSQHHYYVAIPGRPPQQAGQMTFVPLQSFGHIERDSDIWTVAVDHIVAVSPISCNPTSRVDLVGLDVMLRGELRMQESSVCQSAKMDQKRS